MHERGRDFVTISDRPTFLAVSGLKKVKNGGKRSWNIQECSCKQSKTVNGCNAQVQERLGKYIGKHL